MLLGDVRHMHVKCASEYGACLVLELDAYKKCLGLQYGAFMCALTLGLDRGLSVTCPYLDGTQAFAAAGEDEEDDEEEEADEPEGLNLQNIAISKYLKRRLAINAKYGLLCNRVPAWEAVSRMWATLSEQKRINLYFNVKALALGASSGGFCPHFEIPPDDGASSVLVCGDRDLYARTHPLSASLLDSRTSCRFWTSCLLVPPVPDTPGETYVEWRLEGSTSEPPEVLIGICGESAAEAIRAGGVGWKQTDAFMYYLESGFKYCGGTSLNFSPGAASGPQVKLGDRFGLLVESYPLSKSNSNGAKVTLCVNDKWVGQVFSERNLKRGEAGDVLEWPDPVYFVVDVLTPGITCRILRERTWHSTIPSIRLRNSTWDVKRGAWTL